MEGYIKGTLGPFIPVHINGIIEESMQGYSKGSVEPFIPVHNNGLVEA
jgi:hypothetical protein